MTKNIYYQGIDWEIEYDWEDDARTNMSITAVKVQSSDADLYDHLLESTLDGLYEALEESFE
jgi:hypothetical protein